MTFGKFIRWYVACTLISFGVHLVLAGFARLLPR